jgi:hypothetical protein
VRRLALYEPLSKFHERGPLDTRQSTVRTIASHQESILSRVACQIKPKRSISLVSRRLSKVLSPKLVEEMLLELAQHVLLYYIALRHIVRGYEI